MISTGTFFVLCLVVFILYSLLLMIENNLRRRIIFGSLRNWLDKVLIKIINFIKSKLTYLNRYIIKLSWYYSLHRFLRLILMGLVKSYDFLELIFLKNRDRAKVIRIEKKNLKNSNNHLKLMADHKIDTTLTEKEKKELLSRKLEG